jgi:hypothetical protein
MLGVIKRHKKITAAVTVAVLAAGAGTAWAFMNNSVTGTGTTNTQTVQSPAIVAVVPAGTIDSGGVIFNALTPVHLTLTNPSGTPATLVSISGVVQVDAAHVTAGCLASWFSFATVTENQSLPNGTVNVTLTNATGNINFPNIVGTNQAACAGAQVSVALTAN